MKGTFFESFENVWNIASPILMSLAWALHYFRYTSVNKKIQTN